MQQLKIEHYIPKKFILVLTLLFSIPVSYGQEEEINTIDKTHKDISNYIINFTEGIDEYFANGRYSEITNESQLRLSMLTRFKEADHPEYEPDINLRMDVPRTQKRLQLVIEPSDSDERSETSDSQEGRRSPRNDSTTNAGLRYVIDATGIKFSSGAGVVVGLPMKVFMRGTARKQIDFTEWKLKIREELLWINTDGLSSDLDVDFYKDISKTLEFKFVNNATWDEENEIIEFENGPSLFQTITDRRGISYHAHVFTVNKPEIMVTNYLLQITYTQNILKKWIFANFTPFINFPRENNFHREPGFNIRFDMLFGYFK